MLRSMTTTKYVVSDFVVIFLQARLHISFCHGSGRFPDVYKGENAPPAFGDRVPGMNSSAPVYRYGWVVSRAELYEAMNGKPHTLDVWLREIDAHAGDLLYSRWMEKGYDDNDFK